MCGIAGFLPSESVCAERINSVIKIMNHMQAHRGPDDRGLWIDKDAKIGLGHVRLSIIDLFKGHQPMVAESSGLVIVYNGEIYNYIELRQTLGIEKFKTTSDTETILRAYEKWGRNCVDHFRGMFAFAIWDKKKDTLFCARDRFGIKPFYFAETKEGFFFASEAKALLPFVDEIATDYRGLKDYLTFQFIFENKTLFKDIEQLPPAHTMVIKNGHTSISRYWDVYYKLDWKHSEGYFKEKIDALLTDSVKLHLRSDVPVGAYLSGGLDSSILVSLARAIQNKDAFHVFTGKFDEGAEYDESVYAKKMAEDYKLDLHELVITPKDFIDNIRKVIYHLDYPVAGPGSFPQYMVSKLASQYTKVALGGQGGDEIFGGYTRYLLAYFELCIKGAIEGTMHSGNFIVTYESIIPNLMTLRDYAPLMKEFWSDGLFGNRDERYFKLINRASGMEDKINWDLLGRYSSFDNFKKIFWGKNVGPESYFDNMTHFDFKTLLPALLQVEDRMSMAHGLESRTPLLDHPIVELAASIPSNIKFKNGDLKHFLKNTFKKHIPKVIRERKDKKGFPVPLSLWLRSDLKDFVLDIFSSQKARNREYLHPKLDTRNLMAKEGKFSRRVWALLSLELWQQEFHDKEHEIKNIYKTKRDELEHVYR